MANFSLEVLNPLVLLCRCLLYVLQLEGSFVKSWKVSCGNIGATCKCFATLALENWHKSWKLFFDKRYICMHSINKLSYKNS